MARGASDNQALPRSQSGSTLRRMQSETLFGRTRGESANSNGGSQARVIEVPKVVKAIHGAPPKSEQPEQLPPAKAEETNIDTKQTKVDKPGKG